MDGSKLRIPELVAVGEELGLSLGQAKRRKPIMKLLRESEVSDEEIREAWELIRERDESARRAQELELEREEKQERHEIVRRARDL